MHYVQMFLAEPTHELEYRCLGIVKGKFQSLANNAEDENFFRGRLIINKKRFVCHLINQSLTKYLRKNHELLKDEHYWIVFIKTHPTVSIQIKHLKNDLPSDQKLEHDSFFSVRGVVSSIDKQRTSFRVQIKRNKPANTKNAIKQKSFDVTIHGKVPEDIKLGQFLDVKAYLEDHKLILKSHTFIKNIGIKFPIKQRKRFNRPPQSPNKFTTKIKVQS